jgi:hypothetical protein
VTASLAIDLKIGLVDDAARRVFRRESRDEPSTIHPEIAAMMADDTACFLCGDKFSDAVHRNRWHPDSCDLCIKNRARS